jgi:CBS domain-containing protein
MSLKCSVAGTHASRHTRKINLGKPNRDRTSGLDGMKIGEALPHIFKRTYPVLEPGTQMLLAVSLLRFHQIDALPIGFKPKQKKKLAVFGFSCLSKLQETPSKEYNKFLEMPCEKASLELPTIRNNESIEELLRVFEKTRFGFAWVESERLGGFASLRDLLELYGNGVINTQMKVEQVASPIFSMPRDSKIKTVLEEMFKHRFRRMFVSGENSLVTDRRIISYIFSTTRLTETTKNPETLLDAKLGDLDKMEPIPINGETSIKKAALSMKDAVEECLICGKGVVTPWDLVMKPLLNRKLVLKE